jgi:hypothetical protein
MNNNFIILLSSVIILLALAATAATNSNLLETLEKDGGVEKIKHGHWKLTI